MISVGIANGQYVIILNGQIEVLDELGMMKVIDALIALVDGGIPDEPGPTGPTIN